MNREAVALGTPVYTTFGGKLGAVDEALIRDGRLVRLERRGAARPRRAAAATRAAPPRPERPARPARRLTETATTILAPSRDQTGPESKNEPRGSLVRRRSTPVRTRTCRQLRAGPGGVAAARRKARPRPVGRPRRERRQHARAGTGDLTPLPVRVDDHRAARYERTRGGTPSGDHAGWAPRRERAGGRRPTSAVSSERRRSSPADRPGTRSRRGATTTGLEGGRVEHRDPEDGRGRERHDVDRPLSPYGEIVPATASRNPSADQRGLRAWSAT